MAADAGFSKIGHRHRTLADEITAEMRNLIVEGTLAAGARLVERDLAGKMAVSRIPLREAIQQLESEGLVERLPRRGAVVSRMTRHDAENLFDIRIALEPLAAGLAADRATPDDVADLGRHLARAQDAMKHRNARQITESNATFHVDIARYSRNDQLIAIMAPIHSRMRLLFRLLVTTSTDPAILCREHQGILDAIRVGDRAGAEALTRRHVIGTREPTLALLGARENGTA